MSLRNYNHPECWKKHSRKTKKAMHREFVKNLKKCVASKNWSETQIISKQYEREIEAINSDRSG